MISGYIKFFAGLSGKAASTDWEKISYDFLEQMPEDIVDQAEIYKRAGVDTMKKALAAGRREAIRLIKQNYYLNPASTGGGMDFSKFSNESAARSAYKMHTSPTVTMGRRMSSGVFLMELVFSGEHKLLNSFGLAPGKLNSQRHDTVSIQFKKNSSPIRLESAFIRTHVPKKKPVFGRTYMSDLYGYHPTRGRHHKVTNYPKRSVFVVSQRARPFNEKTKDRFRKITPIYHRANANRRAFVEQRYLDTYAEQLRQLVGPRLDQMALSGVTPTKGEQSIMNQVANTICDTFAENIVSRLEHTIAFFGGNH